MLVFHDPDLQKLAPSRLEIGTYTTDTVKLVYSCTFYLVYFLVTFFVASNNGSILLSCATMHALGLIQPCTRLDYLPPRTSLITSSADHPKKTKCQPAMHVSRKACARPTQLVTVPKLITIKEQILQAYLYVFDGIGCFPGPPYHIHVDPSITPKQTPCQLIPVHSKEPFKEAIDKMLQMGILKPVHQSTPWINSFVLVEGKGKLGKLKLRICLDPTNLNKAIVHEPYHFKTPEGIAHLLADACVIMVSDCRKGFWHQQLHEASCFLTIFNTELGRFHYTVNALWSNNCGGCLHCKLDKCFGKIEQVIIIADDFMIVGYKPNHSNHDQAFTTLLQTAKQCNLKLNYEKLQYKQNEVEFFGETYTTSGLKPSKDKVATITSIPSPTNKKQVQSFIGMVNYLATFSLRFSELAKPII